VHRQYFKPPKHLVEEWPEVFKDLYMDTMPVAYVDKMIIEFTDGRIWEINIKEQLEKEHPDKIAKKLLKTLSEYKDTVKNLDFKIDVELLKNDIKKKTKKIL
jgi:hypothetical protein